MPDAPHLLAVLLATVAARALRGGHLAAEAELGRGVQGKQVHVKVARASPVPGPPDLAQVRHEPEPVGPFVVTVRQETPVVVGQVLAAVRPPLAEVDRRVVLRAVVGRRAETAARRPVQLALRTDVVKVVPVKVLQAIGEVVLVAREDPDG
jgi:hypothetical protein